MCHNVCVKNATVLTLYELFEDRVADFSAALGEPVDGFANLGEKPFGDEAVESRSPFREERRVDSVACPQSEKRALLEVFLFAHRFDGSCRTAMFMGVLRGLSPPIAGSGEANAPTCAFAETDVVLAAPDREVVAALETWGCVVGDLVALEAD